MTTLHKALEQALRALERIAARSAQDPMGDAVGWANAALTEGRKALAQTQGEEVIAYLCDDAAALREENPECEIASNMERAAALLQSTALTAYLSAKSDTSKL